MGHRNPVAIEQQIKGSRNEFLRACMANGWYDEAIEIATQALTPLQLDRTCPNRAAVVRQALGRVLVEAGQVEQGQARLTEASELSTAFMALIEEGWRKYGDLDREMEPPGSPPPLER